MDICGFLCCRRSLSFFTYTQTCGSKSPQYLLEYTLLLRTLFLKYMLPQADLVCSIIWSYYTCTHVWRVVHDEVITEYTRSPFGNKMFKYNYDTQNCPREDC